MFGLSYSLEEVERRSKDPGLLEPFILMPNVPGVVNQATQSEMTMNDITYIEFREKELKKTIDNLQ